MHSYLLLINTYVCATAVAFLCEEEVLQHCTSILQFPSVLHVDMSILGQRAQVSRSALVGFDGPVQCRVQGAVVHAGKGVTISILPA